MPFLWVNEVASIFFTIAAAIFYLAIWITIFRKIGYSSWLGILMVIPLVDVLLLLWVAFSDWPVHRELRALRAATEPAAR